MSMIDSCLERRELCHPVVLADLQSVVSRLGGVDGGEAAAISGHIVHHCRQCMLHLDDCFMNIIFLAFTSIETGVPIAPNRVRPTMRIVIR